MTASAPVLRYGDVVVVDWRGHELDREGGRVGTLANDAGLEVAAGDGDVVVTVARRGAVTIPRDRLRVFGAIGWPDELPQIGEVVAIAAAVPALGIELRQLARIVERGPIPEHIADRLGVPRVVAGYYLETAGQRGQRIRGWVTGAMFYRLHEIGRAGCQ